MTDAERIDYETTIEALRIERDAWRTVAECRYCLPHRHYWCTIHRAQAPMPHREVSR